MGKTLRPPGDLPVWPIITNDNGPAIDFYQRRGMRLVAVHPNPLELSRRLKPEIPLTGLGGLPLRDELGFDYRFHSPDGARS